MPPIQLTRMMVKHSDPIKVEQWQHIEGIEMQHQVFNHNKKKVINQLNQKETKATKMPEEGEMFQLDVLAIRQDNDEVLTICQSKYCETVFHGHIHPDSSIQLHPAFATLWQYAMEGCSVDCGPSWSKDHLKVAIY